jgi:peptidoglycan/LPS O-acetylase OafA/YrhL
MSSQAHLLYLDGWRGAAIITVLLSHFVGTFLGAGTFGVELFFVLSGYLISGILFIDRVPLKSFFKRRISRIYPAFLFYLAAMYVYARYGSQNHYAVSLEELFFTLTFLRTYLPVDNSIWSELWPIGHIWSLNVEEHSYIWLGCGSFFCRRFKLPRLDWLFIFASLLASCACVLLYAGYPETMVQSPWHLRTECAAVGLLAAAAYRITRYRFAILQKTPPRFFAPILLAIGIFFYSENDLLGAVSLITPICLALALNHLGETYSFILKFLSLAPLRWFGLCSFSIYLWQQPFYTAVMHREPWAVNIGQTVFSAIANAHIPFAEEVTGYLVLIPIIIIGATSCYAIENPCRRYLNKRWAK